MVVPPLFTVDLTPEECAEIARILADPPSPTPSLIRALKRYSFPPPPQPDPKAKP